MDDGLVEDPEQRPEPVWRLRQDEGQGRQGQAVPRDRGAVSRLRTSAVRRDRARCAVSSGRRRRRQRRLEIGGQRTAHDDAPPVDRMGEGEPRRVQHQTRRGVGGRLVAVQRVAEHRVADRRQVDADLVADAGGDSHRQQRRAAQPPQRPVARDGGTRAAGCAPARAPGTRTSGAAGAGWWAIGAVTVPRRRTVAGDRPPDRACRPRGRGTARAGGATRRRCGRRPGRPTSPCRADAPARPRTRRRRCRAAPGSGRADSWRPCRDRRRAARRPACRPACRRRPAPHRRRASAAARSGWAASARVAAARGRRARRRPVAAPGPCGRAGR